MRCRFDIDNFVHTGCQIDMNRCLENRKNLCRFDVKTTIFVVDFAKIMDLLLSILTNYRQERYRIDISSNICGEARPVSWWAAVVSSKYRQGLADVASRPEWCRAWLSVLASHRPKWSVLKPVRRDSRTFPSTLPFPLPQTTENGL